MSKESYGLDEIFKILMKHYFEKFCKVITDFEIIKLPKKADLLIIETDKPITEHVKIFTYFKKVNIIEFKSVNDPFRFKEDLPKIWIYSGGVVSNEKESNIENTTFTLVSSRKPEKLLKYYEKDIQKVQNGVYLIQRMIPIPVYVVVINELDFNLEKEVAILKEFSTGVEREKYLKEIIHRVSSGTNKIVQKDLNNELKELLHFAFSLYKNEIKKIMTEERISMTTVQKNIESWAEELGLKDRYILDGILNGKREDAEKMLEKGCDICFISDITGLSEEEIERLKN